MASIVDRPEQPYVSIPATVTMQTISEAADRLPGLMEWLAARSIQPVAAPFLKYDVIDMAKQLQVRVGVPVPPDALSEAADDVVAGALPAGRYATVVHTGPPSALVGVTRDLLQWGADQGLRWDMTPTDAGDAWGARLEVFLTDPQLEPDPQRWQTEVLLRLAD
jgi:effector-binding domain-containing protein